MTKFKISDRVQFIGSNEILLGVIQAIEEDLYTVITDDAHTYFFTEDYLAPAPALVVVPQWFDTIYRDTKRVYLEGKYDACNVDMIRMICAAEFGSSHNQLIAFTDNLSTAATEYVIKHKLDLIRAVLDGYTVEKEPLYYVKLPYVTWDEDSADLETNFAYLQHDITSDETRVVFSAKIAFSEDFKSELNEATIKSIDERYWAFAVPVEEDTE